MTRRALAVLACLAGVAASHASAQLPRETMTVTLSSHRVSARHVVLRATLRYEMQCGYPGEAPVRLTVPAPPGKLARTAVRVNGKPARSLRVAGRIVTIAMPKRPQILCDAIGPGTLVLRLTGLRNPAAAGTYRVAALKGRQTFDDIVLVHR
jgi:hypothetical protein